MGVLDILLVKAIQDHLHPSDKVLDIVHFERRELEVEEMQNVDASSTVPVKTEPVGYHRNHYSATRGNLFVLTPFYVSTELNPENGIP